MKIKCSLIRAEVTFVDEKRWSKCWFEMLIEVLLDVLIQVPFDDLTGLSEDCIQRWNDWTHWRIFEFLSKNCIWHWNNQMHWRIFEFLSKNCIWHWNSQMHWRVFEFVKKLHLILKQSNALTNFLCICQKIAFWWSNALTNFRFVKKLHSDDEMHWRVFDLSRCFGYKCNGEVLIDVTQAGR